MGIPTELSVRLETEDPQIPFRSLNDKIYCNAEGKQVISRATQNPGARPT